jgi:hypothetical protein
MVPPAFTEGKTVTPVGAVTIGAAPAPYTTKYSPFWKCAAPPGKESEFDPDEMVPVEAE